MKRRRDGFTLMEVLAAMLLLGIVLPAAMGGMSLCLRVASEARHEQEAALLAEAKLNELLVTRGTTPLGTGGTFGDDWPEYRWSLDTTAGAFDVEQVDVTVRWQDRGQTRSLTMSTMMLPATAAGTTGTAFGS